MSRKTYAMAIRDTLAEEMRRDDRVFVMGEDVELAGGVFGCTRDFVQRIWGRAGTEHTDFRSRNRRRWSWRSVHRNASGGRADVHGFYFCSNGSNFNQAAKTRYVFGGKAKIPLVIRGQQGIGRGNAATHSQSVESILCIFQV